APPPRPSRISRSLISGSLAVPRRSEYPAEKKYCIEGAPPETSRLTVLAYPSASEVVRASRSRLYVSTLSIGWHQPSASAMRLHAYTPPPLSIVPSRWIGTG